MKPTQQPNVAQMKKALAQFQKGTKVKERVYHGTGNLEGLTAFDPAMTGKGTDQLGSGFYFTTHPDEASGYATSVTPNVSEGTPKLGGDSSPGMVAAHLAIKKPIKIGPKGSSLNDARINLSHDQVKQIISSAPNILDPDESPLGNHVDTSRGVTPKMIHDISKLYTGNQLHSLENDIFPGSPTEYRHALHKATGHDGVVKDFGDGRKHYVAWFPEQVKSAIGNRGTYDPANPDITMAEGGNVKPSVAQMKLALNKQGMYSPLEKAAMAVPRTKGTPAEFMAEASKQPGFRKEEVADRKISLPEQKMTKDEFLTHLKGHASPKLEEKVIGGDEPDEDNGYTQYEEYKLPGGSNYREVLLKTPTFPEAKNRQIMELEANIRRMNPADYPPGYVQNMIDGVAKLKAEKAAAGDAYQSSHWSDDPNVLAHIRLSDRFAGDKGKFVVEGTKGGKKQFLFATGINGTPEQAQEAAKRWEAQGYQTDINQVGGGKKLLHVEEIQSDWHQQGRKEGYRGNYTELPTGYEVKEVDAPGGRKEHRVFDPQGSVFASGMSAESATRNAIENLNGGRKVPDAPFKKSWHEMAMKHILNHAANNGYDGIVITPGQEQADRYDLSKKISSIAYDPQEKLLDAWDHNRRQVMRREITNDSQLADYIGKEAASKLLQTEPMMGKHLLEGQDLKVGGEGMKGFYDKIVPDYLNKLGKPHGAQVQMNAHPVKGSPDDYGKAVEQLGIADVPMDQLTPEQNQQIAAAADKRLHYFPITDSMRQQIKTEGLPQYQVGGIIHKAEGGNVQPSTAEMRMALAKHNPIELQKIGVNEAPNMSPKAFFSPEKFRGMGMPAPGGVDLNQMQPGQQLVAQPPQPQGGLPQQPGQPQGGQPPQQPGQPPQGGMAPPAPPAAPAGPTPPGGGNILQMTPQGRALGAMGAQRPPAPGMADGGGVDGKPLHYGPAPVLSRADIESHAERMARQMSGQDNPNKKTQQQIEREQNLAVDIQSGGKKMKVPTLNFEDFKNAYSVGVPGDPSRGGVIPRKNMSRRMGLGMPKAGEYLKGIGGTDLESPVPLYGGKDYGAYGHPEGWASDLGASAGMFNVVKRLAGEDPSRKVLGHYHKMSPESLNHAVHMLDTILSYHQPHNASPDHIDVLNKLMREVQTTKNKSDGPYPEFPGFENPSEVMLHGAMNSGMRKKIINILGTSKYFPGGKQKLEDAQYAISHPELRNIETGAGGNSILEFDPLRDLKPTISSHPTYGYNIPSKLIGKTKYTTPADILAPRSMNNARQEIEAMGKKVVPFNQAKLNIIREPIDEQYINQMGEYENAMRKRLGYKKGGKVKLHTDKDTMSLELSLKSKKAK